MTIEELLTLKEGDILIDSRLSMLIGGEGGLYNPQFRTKKTYIFHNYHKFTFFGNDYYSVGTTCGSYINIAFLDIYKRQKIKRKVG